MVRQHPFKLQGESSILSAPTRQEETGGSMRIIDNIPVYGASVDEGALAQIKTCARTADRVALMADHHKGYAVPIGGVVAYADSISPSGVGYDIACGNKAVLTEASAEEVKRNIGAIMDRVWATISFGMGRKNDDERVDHELFDDPAWNVEACKPLKEMARRQLGTVGSGNHYVDIFEDQQGRVWIGVHFGSRGLGHKTATWFLRAAGASDGMDVEPCILPVASDLGAQYLEAMRLGGRYAYAGRDWVCARVARLLGANVIEEVHNHHVTSRGARATAEQDLWGCAQGGRTPGFPRPARIRGRIDGRPGSRSLIEGRRAREHGGNALCSTVHGAGRVMGRMEAKGKVDRKTGEVKRAGKVTQAMMNECVAREGVELRGAGLDESPHCYKRLPEVLAEHGDSIRILHTLRPLGVAMAGEEDVHDPYKGWSSPASVQLDQDTALRTQRLGASLSAKTVWFDSHHRYQWADGAGRVTALA